MVAAMLRGTTAIALLFLAAMAGAQQSDVGQTGSFAIEEVVVTARKREESLQDAPISVAAFTVESLELRQIDTTDKLGQITPNLTFDSNAPSSGHSSAAQIYIRGIGQNEFLASSDPGVGLYIDGVYIARSIGSVVRFLDVHRIEVLRGPQGTLFGRNTIGGAIVLHTRRPTESFEGAARIKIGSDSLIDGYLRLSGPLSDNLAGNVTFGYRSRDGYVSRLQTGEDLGDDNEFGLRGSLLWTPSDTVEVLLSADYVTEDENGAPLVFGDINTSATFPILASLFAGCPGSMPPGPGSSVPDIDDPRCANQFADAGNFANNGVDPVESTLDVWGLALTVDWSINDNIGLKSITGYRAMENTATRDADNTPLTILETVNIDDQHQFSQEFQLTGSGFDNRFNWLLGAYYFEEQNDNITRPTLPVVELQLDGISETDATAIFGQATYYLTDQFSVTAGIRSTSEDKRFLPDQVTLTDFPTPGGVIPAGTPIVPNVEEEISISENTSMLSVAYAWTDAVMTYATYSESFKSGGFNARNVVPLPELPQFGPEFADTIEIGAKTILFDNTLRFNAAWFSTNYEDLQIVFRSGIAPVLFNAGESSISGFEVEGNWVPTQNWLIDFGIGYIDASYDEIVDPGDGFNTSIGLDSKFVQTPEYTGNLGVSYTRGFGDWILTPRVDWFYTDDKFFDAPNTPQIFQSSTNIVNATFALDHADGQWRFALGVVNVTDEEYLVAGTSAFTTGTGYVEHVFARERQWTLSAEYNW